MLHSDCSSPKQLKILFYFKECQEGKQFCTGQVLACLRFTYYERVIPSAGGTAKKYCLPVYQEQLQLLHFASILPQQNPVI